VRDLVPGSALCYNSFVVHHCTHLTPKKGRTQMATQPKKKAKANAKTTITRIISLVLAALLLGGILMAAVFANVY